MQVDRGLAVEVRRGATSSFSPILTASCSTASPTVWPEGSGAALASSTVSALLAAAALTASAARAWNSVFLATKSVSAPSWSRAPSVKATSPLVAERSAPRLAALACPLTRRISTALS